MQSLQQLRELYTKEKTKTYGMKQSGLLAEGIFLLEYKGFTRNNNISVKAPDFIDNNNNLYDLKLCSAQDHKGNIFIELIQNVNNGSLNDIFKHNATQLYWDMSDTGEQGVYKVNRDDIERYLGLSMSELKKCLENASGYLKSCTPRTFDSRKFTEGAYLTSGGYHAMGIKLNIRDLEKLEQ